MVLHGGNIAEMKTGEGKTLTATLAVCLNALAGKGVHVVTVNDYLARRDAEWMSPIYDLLGFSWGVLQNMQEGEAKIQAYAADITYGTNSEFGFDYLRDNMAQSIEEKVQHGGRIGEDGRPLAMHNFAIVDEVDNILIDEARTPLIISGAPEQAADLYVKFAKLAKQMEPGKTPEGMDPRAKKDFVADFDFEFDEKHKTVAITEQGVAKAERFMGIDHLYRAENGHLVNHLIQSLKAESLYKRDVDYAVVDDQVMIIDEFTGRILEGRRWSEGLHQAIEAKEGVRVQEENQTLATITLQNYFRLYDKLAGMTGTALTEATEFKKIYELGVVQIPTNMPMVRDDCNDQVYKTQGGQVERRRPGDRGAPRKAPAGARRHDLRRGLRAAVRAAARARASSTPSSTPSPSTPSARARSSPRPVAPASVTIATNMAGRGVDIKLGGNPEHLAETELRTKLGLKPGDPDYLERAGRRSGAERSRSRSQQTARSCIEAGGLFICGTERHESRRIDNQLRGRSGRQGDPGESRFFLSAEDDLVRLFAGDRIYKILDRLGSVDEEGNEEPIEAGMLTKQIEKAQKKVEEQNFLIRKRVLEYDDVMNEQRRVVYAYRDDVLEGKDLGEQARHEVAGVVQRLVDEYAGGDYVEEWDLTGLFVALTDIVPADLLPEDLTIAQRQRRRARPRRPERAPRGGRRSAPTTPREAVRRRADARARALPARCRSSTSAGASISTTWTTCARASTCAGSPRSTRSIAYKNEAFTLFQDLMNSIWSDFTRMVFHVEVEVEVEDPAAIPFGAPAAAARRGPARSATQVAAAARPPARSRRPPAGGSEYVTAYGDEEPMEVAPQRRAARARRGRADRAQRPVLVRVGQEIQEVPRGLAPGSGLRTGTSRPR